MTTKRTLVALFFLLAAKSGKSLLNMTVRRLFYLTVVTSLYILALSIGYVFLLTAGTWGITPFEKQSDGGCF